MTNVLDNLRQEPQPIIWQNVKGYPAKTEGEQFMMSVSSSNCCTEHVRECCHMSSTCDALQGNVCPDCWAMMKSYTILPSAVSQSSGVTISSLCTMRMQHTSLLVGQRSTSTKMTVIPTLPVHHTLNPFDLFLFPKMKLKLGR
jgi:hypothetical protein